MGTPAQADWSAAQRDLVTQALQASVHSSMDCADCHSDELHSGAAPSVDCATCHSDVQEVYSKSVHGRAPAGVGAPRPNCVTCHGGHKIARAAGSEGSEFRGKIAGVCSTCHASELIMSNFGIATDRVRTYLESYHGMAGRAGEVRVANCASCHGWHDVLPSSDTSSRIHPDNLARTCGQCHPGAGPQLVSARIHKTLAGSGEGGRAAAVVRKVYRILIIAVLGGMAIFNAADFLRKGFSSSLRSTSNGDEGEMLLSLSERIQHGFLILSFAALAYSGFALKYPDALWAEPFAWLGGEQVRLIFHRSAAVLFLLLGVYHAGYLLFTNEGRRRLKQLLPTGHDLADPFRLLAYNIGLSASPPALGRWSFIEKLEYWALVWGSAVMTATGAILVFHNFALAHFRLWVIEVAGVAHYLEAILACGAIVIWHFYWVIFNPDVYPMNASWLTGRRRRK